MRPTKRSKAAGKPLVIRGLSPPRLSSNGRENYRARRSGRREYRWIHGPRRLLSFPLERKDLDAMSFKREKSHVCFGGDEMRSTVVSGP